MSEPEHPKEGQGWPLDYRIVEGVKVPTAASFVAYHCGDPDCQHLHLVGKDKDDVPAFEIVISDESLQGVVNYHRSLGGKIK